jgi:cysteinyl-tRNA synthetase
MGQSGATIRRPGEKHVLVSGQTFDLNVLGKVKIPKLSEELPNDVVEAVLSVEQSSASLPPDVAALIEKRESARREKDWPQSDALRKQLADQGYLVEDTPQGPRWRRVAIS